MILIVTALQPETAPLVKHFSLKRDLTISAFEVYANSHIALIKSGIGKIKAAAATTLLFTKYGVGANTLTVNFGIAAGSTNLNLGELYLVNKVLDAASGRSIFPDLLLKHEFREASLASVDKPVSFDPMLSDLVDMEAFGFAEACKLFLPSHQMLITKIVSDHFSPQDLDVTKIQNLVEAKIPNIEKLILDTQEGLSALKPFSLSEADQSLVNRLCVDLQLTASQTTQLNKVAVNAAIRGKNLGLLNQYFGRALQGKAQLAPLLEDITNALLS